MNELYDEQTFISIDEILGTIAGGITDPVSQIRRVWGEVIGSERATRCAPSRLVRKTLHISCENAQWAQELNMDSESILRRLHAAAPLLEISRLSIRAQR